MHQLLNNGVQGVHIPDGFLDPLWSIITYAVAIAYLGISYTRSRSLWSIETTSLVTVLAAGIFAAQMLNWPIPGGTSLHFVGGALAGIILGPFLGALTISLVLIVQCLVFHDGGLTALGANILNMGIVAVLSGYLLYRLSIKLVGRNEHGRFIGGFLGGWISITLAGILCGLEIGLSPQFPYGVLVSIPVMGLWHLVLGVVEGLITGLVVVYISKKEPGFILAERGVV